MSTRPTLARWLEIVKIRTDGDTQGRLKIDWAIVQEYSELMQNGVAFPPVRVWFDGNDYRLVDGFHRLAAARKIGASDIPADVFQGSLDDARWDSHSSNATRGLRRTTEDTEAIMRKAFEHPRSRDLSTNQVARHLHLPEATVRRWRRKLSNPMSGDTIRIASRSGRTYVMETSRIGRGYTPRATKVSEAQVLQRFAVLRAAASPDARRLLNVLEKWIFRQCDNATSLAAIDHLIRSFRSPSDRQKEHAYPDGDENAVSSCRQAVGTE